MNFWLPAQGGDGSFQVDQVWETHLEFCLRVKGTFPEGAMC